MKMSQNQLNNKISAGLHVGVEKPNKDEEHLNQVRHSPSSKARFLSDAGLASFLPPSESKETGKRISQDDSAIIDTPITPRKSGIQQRGLSLQMPMYEPPEALPSSPNLDQSQTFGFPTGMLPRRSRGLDFSRAATNLHHSTLAEQSSPEASPTITSRTMNMHNRTSSLNFSDMGDYISHPGSHGPKIDHSDRINASNSLGSINVTAGSDSSENFSDEDELMEDVDDSIITILNQDTPGLSWGGQSSGTSNMMKLRRKKLLNRKDRTGLSHGSSNSKFCSITNLPPILHNLEVTGNMSPENSPDAKHLRRESISWAANQLRISGSENDDGTPRYAIENAESSPVTPGRDGQRGVIRRPVTRRGNMLPKTKGFARVQAALAEESAPVETEVRREAEVVRQTRENDMDLEPRYSSNIPSSPSMTPEADSYFNASSDLKQQLINSQGKSTSPQLPTCPNNFVAREDILLGSPMIYTAPLFPGQSADNRSSSPSRPDTPLTGTGPTAAEITLKLNKKRRRNDIDISSLKRRAVSPGISVHNSPVAQSPMQRDHPSWGSRTPSNCGYGEVGKSSTNALAKRIGLQGMVDTNDGLMKMSIE